MYNNDIMPLTYNGADMYTEQNKNYLIILYFMDGWKH